MYHTEPPTDKTIREWYMNSSRVAACALRNEQAVRAHGRLKVKSLISYTDCGSYVVKRDSAYTYVRVNDHIVADRSVFVHG